MCLHTYHHTAPNPHRPRVISRVNSLFLVPESLSFFCSAAVTVTTLPHLRSPTQIQARVLVYAVITGMSTWAVVGVRRKERETFRKQYQQASSVSCPFHCTRSLTKFIIPCCGLIYRIPNIMLLPHL